MGTPAEPIRGVLDRRAVPEAIIAHSEAAGSAASPAVTPRSSRQLAGPVGAGSQGKGRIRSQAHLALPVPKSAPVMVTRVGCSGRPLSPMAVKTLGEPATARLSNSPSPLYSARSPLSGSNTLPFQIPTAT